MPYARLTASLGLLIACASAQAGAPESLLEQHIVARANTVPLLQAPLAASSFNEQRLAAAGVRQLTELAASTPGFSLSPAQATLAIRGIGGRAVDLAPGVAVYADGVYLGDWRFLDAARFFDTETVEVLRGPQSVALGPDAVGGALRLYSAPPPVTWQSKVVAEAGSGQLRALQGLIRGPITDQFAMSVAGSTLRRDALDHSPVSATDRAPLDDQYLRAAFTYHWTNLWYSRLQALDVDREGGDLRAAMLLNEIALGELRARYLASWSERAHSGEFEARNGSHELSLYSAADAAIGFSAGLLYRDEHVRFAAPGPSQDNESLSAWLTAELPVTAHLGVAAGLRYSDLQAQRSATVTAQHWDGDLTVSYRWRDSQHVYLRLASGHAGPGRLSLEEETQPGEYKLAMAELGYKATFLDGRLQTVLAAYQNRPEDLAGAQSNSVGLEWEIRWQPGQHWHLGASWAWADSDRPALQAQQQLSLFASADWRWAWAEMVARMEYLGQSGVCPEPTPCPGARGESSHRWDASLTAHYREWSLSAYADNLADQRDWYTYPGNGPDGELTAPRQLGLRLTYQLR